MPNYSHFLKLIVGKNSIERVMLIEGDPKVLGKAMGKEMYENFDLRVMINVAIETHNKISLQATKEKIKKRKDNAAGRRG